LCLFSQIPVLRYKKQPMLNGKHFHATFNFIDTLGSAFPELALDSTISGFADNDYYKQVMSDLFPTLVTDGVTDGHRGEEGSLSTAKYEALLDSNAKIAIVPGVGKFRPHRAWPLDYWLVLCKDILQSTNCSLEFIGGRDEAELIQNLITALPESPQRIGSFSPTASLVDTASILKSCRLVISGDTGPAHLSVALGIPVLGIYGPTYIERSGPYGCGKEAITNSQECRCQAQKICNLKPDQRGAGSCMLGIGPDLLMAKLKSILYY
jgi:ADP-heptose:LPS heptosyltransferase